VSRPSRALDPADTLRVPLSPRHRRGNPCPVPVLTLSVRCVDDLGQADWKPICFQVDTGTDITILSVTRAEGWGIPVPWPPAGNDHVPTANTLSGALSGRYGRVQVYLLGRMYEWDCFFADLPVSDDGESVSRPPVHRPTRSVDDWIERYSSMSDADEEPPRDQPPLLGRSGFLAEFNIAIDDSWLTVTRRARKDALDPSPPGCSGWLFRWMKNEQSSRRPTDEC
jgi:hypothetical protein